MDAKPRLLDQVREQLRLRHYSYRTEQQYLAWIRRFIRFHGLQHPSILGAKEIEAFLSHLALERRVASSTQIRPSRHSSSSTDACSDATCRR